MQTNDIDQRKVYKVVISLMITIAQSLERKNEKASFLGLASFNSSLKKFSNLGGGGNFHSILEPTSHPKERDVF